MSMSTLPIWLEIILFGMIFFAFAGLFAPYVSAKDEEKARKVDRLFGKKPDSGLIPITIRCRVDLAGLGYCPAIMLIVIANVAFCIESFSVVSKYVSPFLLVAGVAIIDFLLWIMIQAIMSIAATVISRALERYYRRTYYVDVEIDTEFDRIGIGPNN